MPKKKPVSPFTEHQMAFGISKEANVMIVSAKSPTEAEVAEYYAGNGQDAKLLEVDLSKLLGASIPGFV